MHRAALACCLLLAATLACQSAPPPEPPPLRADYEDPHPAVEAYLTIAAHRAGRGDREGALTVLDAATRKVPTSGAARLRRARLLARSDDPAERAEAQEAVAAIEAVHPNAEGLPAVRASIALGAGDPDAAWEAIEPSLGQSSDADVHVLAAEILLAQGRETDAIREAGEVLEAAPGNGPALAVRARAHQRLGADVAAAADARLALRARPDDAELRLLRAESLLRTGNPRRAQATLDALAPGARSARSDRLAAAIALERGDATAAREAYERGLERAPGDGETLRALAQLDLIEEDPDAALERLADDPTPAGTVLRARALHAADRPDEAAALLRTLLVGEPDLLEPWGLLLALGPEGESPTERARAAWEGPTPDPAAEAIPGTALLSAIAEEDEKRSAAHYEEALAQRPGLALAANNRASQLLAARDETERALQLAQAAHEATGRDPAVTDTFGWALLEASRPGEAIDVLSHGLAASDPRDDLSLALRARRAQAYEAAGEPAEALTAADALLAWHARRVAAAERAGDAPPAAPPWLADVQGIHDRHSEPEPEASAPAPTPEPAPEAPTATPTEPAPEAPTATPTEPAPEAPTATPTEPAPEAPTATPTEPVPEGPATTPTEPDADATADDAPGAEAEAPAEPLPEPETPDPTPPPETATDD